MTAEFDLKLADGRRLHVYDTGGPGTPVFWHHGTPNIGAPPVPLMRPEVRWISHDRPGYGGSTPLPGRDIASAAADVAAIADELAIPHFAVMGLDWFAGMAPSSGASLRAARNGRAAKEAHEAAGEEKEKEEAPDAAFTPADEAMFGGPWSWLLDVVRPAIAAGPAALIDDGHISILTSAGAALDRLLQPRAS